MMKHFGFALMVTALVVSAVSLFLGIEYYRATHGGKVQSPRGRAAGEYPIQRNR